MIALLFTTVLLAAPALSAHVARAECDGFGTSDRFDCLPQPDATQEVCEARGCCWAQEGTRLPDVGVPWCFYPKNYAGYSYVNWTQGEEGGVGFLEKKVSSGYPRDVELLRIYVEHQTNSRVRVKISDAKTQRWEPTYPKLTSSNAAPDAPAYQVDIDESQDGFQVKRSTGEVVFNARNVGGFTFADQFLQISSTFSGHIYGLGEHRTPHTWLPTNWTRLTMFNHDVGPREKTNLYGSHPFYLVVEDDGRSYGVYLHNSNAMDVILQPLPAITFRPIGGILDLFFFMGPTPADVIRQYTELVGRPYMPPYWSLGFQLCRWGYGSLNKTREVWQRTRDAGIPFDVQWNDIDYMITQNDFTIDPVTFKDLPKFVDEVHEVGMHYVPILDPGVSAAEPSGTYPPFDDGLEMDVLVKTENGTVYIGKVWNPVSTAYPDFTHPRAVEYWTKQIREFHDKVKFDGLWIDMNEPSNFVDGFAEGCPEGELDYPPYMTGVDGDKLATKTMCMTARLSAGLFYNLHNLYSIYEADVTNQALRDVTGKRPFVLTRSSFTGSGRYTGHWSGDDFSSWDEMYKSIQEVLTSSMFGMSQIGADICGFGGDTTPALCNRWMQLGAFYPFSRNHAAINTKEQDPVALGDQVVRSSIKALRVRYTLLPYLYTLFYKAHVDGDTVARPLFFEFPKDKNTLEVDTAFLWGSGLYIIPVLKEGATDVSAYLPAGLWYDWYTGKPMNQTRGGQVTLDAPLDTIPLLIRGGTVLPTQASDVTTTASRKNNFTLIAAVDSNGEANGSLFWDDGDSLDTIEDLRYGLLEFNLLERKLTTHVHRWTTVNIPHLEAVQVLGVQETVTKVLVNNKPTNFTQDGSTLLVTPLTISLREDIELVWS